MPEEHAFTTVWQGPVNPKETALRAMLQRAGFPEPKWGQEIPLGLPRDYAWPSNPGAISPPGPPLEGAAESLENPI